MGRPAEPTVVRQHAAPLRPLCPLLHPLRLLYTKTMRALSRLCAACLPWHTPGVVTLCTAPSLNLISTCALNSVALLLLCFYPSPRPVCALVHAAQPWNLPLRVLPSSCTAHAKKLTVRIHEAPVASTEAQRRGRPRTARSWAGSVRWMLPPLPGA